MTFTYHWWSIPTFVTSCVIGWWMIPKNHEGNFPDIASSINAFVGLFIIAFAWAIAGVFK